MSTKLEQFRAFLTAKGHEGRWSEDDLALALTEGGGYLFAQDPAMDNVMVDGHSKPISELGSLHVPGRVMVTEEEFLQAWHDESEDGKPFVRFGIAVGPRVVANAEPQAVDNTRWAFATSSGKLAAFGRWLRTRVSNLLTGRTMREAWRKYVEQGWRKGAARAFDDARQRQKWERHPDTVGTNLYTGGREEFLRSSFNHPESVEKVKLLAARTLTDLDGVTTAMSTNMTRTLADGLTRGEHPYQVAASLVRDVDGIGRKRARMVAQHNFIYAHSEGQLDNLERLGVEDVGVAVEFTVTPDNKLCPTCEALQGLVLKTRKAHGIIPLHPG